MNVQPQTSPNAIDEFAQATIDESEWLYDDSSKEAALERIAVIKK